MKIHMFYHADPVRNYFFNRVSMIFVFLNASKYCGSVLKNDFVVVVVVVVVGVLTNF